MEVIDDTILAYYGKTWMIDFCIFWNREPFLMLQNTMKPKTSCWTRAGAVSRRSYFLSPAFKGFRDYHKQISFYASKTWFCIGDVFSLGHTKRSFRMMFFCLLSKSKKMRGRLLSLSTMFSPVILLRQLQFMPQPVGEMWELGRGGQNDERQIMHLENLQMGLRCTWHPLKKYSRWIW